MKKPWPTILRSEEEIDLRMNAPIDEALSLQKPLPDETLKVVRSGVQSDEGNG